MFKRHAIVAHKDKPENILGLVIDSDSSTTKVYSFDTCEEIQYSSDWLIGYTPLKKENYSDFQEELDRITEIIKNSLSNILLSKDRTSKHEPWTWREEQEDEHLNKALRHIITYQLQRDGHQKPDGEQHLDNAITRLAMALAK